MNVLKQLMQKACLALGVILLWLLDDLVVVMPTQVVWTVMRSYLSILGRSDRYDALVWFWTGTRDKEPPGE